MNHHKSSKRCTAIVSYHDFANEAWLYMETHHLSQVEVINGEAIIGTLTKARLDELSRETRLQLDVKDLIYQNN